VASDDLRGALFVIYLTSAHLRKVKESLNVTFDETPQPFKTSPLVDDDLDEEETIKVTEKKNLENDIEDETLEIDKIVNIKESRNYPLENVIGNLNQRTLRSQAQNQSNFFGFISTIELKIVNEALADESWIVAMQEELNQFIANDVWEFVPKPRNMKIIGTKWVFRNKLDENGIQIVENMNGLSVVLKITNQYGNRNVVTAPTEGNGNVINGNPIRCYNCQGEGHYTNNCTVKLRKQDSAYLQQQLQIAQEEEAGIQRTQEEFKFMDVADASEETEANYILENNLQHASTSGAQSNKAPYTELPEPIPEPHQVPQNDSNVIFEVSSVEQEAAKFVRDFKSLAKEADESIAKQKALELEIECLLRVVFSQDIMSVVQHNSVVDTSNLQTELERFENCIIKKENEYAKLWNDWYKKCEECKYDKISYDKAYNDMQQKIKWLQSQLGDLKGKSKDTSSVSDTLNPLTQKLENENVELEFQVRNYEMENAYLKDAYKNLFNSINVGEMHALSKLVTSNLVPTPTESKVVKNDNMISPGIFRINPFKASREPISKRLPNSTFSMTGVDMIVMTSMIEMESLSVICSMNNSNGENQVVSKSSTVTTADASDKRQ
nr:retrovirus-related Pol polyprotein from transposon TNT 1-94 [Tanacetum cinerariifolium]